MRLLTEQKELLKNYSISYKDIDYKSIKVINELLMEIDDEMTTHVDDNDEPTEDFLILENLYDDIFYRFKEVD